MMIDVLTASIKGIGVVKLVAGAIVGMISFAVAQEWTKSVPLAVVCQGFSTIGAAYLMNRHKYAGVQNQHELALLDRIHQSNADAMDFMTARLEQQNKLIAVLTIVKHALAGEVEAARRTLEVRGELLKDANISFREVVYRDLLELTKEEDKLRAEIAGIDTGIIERMRGN